jgi:preprotein translocase subunit SecD
MLNRYPLWKYLLLAAILLLGILYAAPNLYGEDFAIQVSPSSGYELSATQRDKIKAALNELSIPYKSVVLENPQSLLIRFPSDQAQRQAQDVIRAALGQGYIAALNLAPVTPKWLAKLGAKPLKLGLDLRGGVHFLMDVDIAGAIERRMDNTLSEVRGHLREARLRYTTLKPLPNAPGLQLTFNDKTTAEQSYHLLRKKLSDWELTKEFSHGNYGVIAKLSPTEVQTLTNYTVEQTIATLRNRVNELGVAEAVVQRQGSHHVVVELPGIQDTARAKDILGKTATIQFHMYDDEHEARQGMRTVPPGSKIYYDRQNNPYLLKKRVILSGDSITGAVTATDQHGMPAVSIRIGGGELGLFKKTTRESIGKQMAVVYIESKIEQSLDDGEVKKTLRTDETLINLATIRSALGSNFQITNLGLAQAQDLSLLLRSGALPATISIVEERTVGPSLGQENIRLGVISVQVGLALVMLAMLLYYHVFGLIANIALVINIILLLATLSLLGATLTLPGIAGIVLTVGMAVDANVLIFERIREELSNGMTPQAAIHSGFERAFSTIIDANITTLIVGVILFSIGTGPVRGFAVTLCIGLLTSMLTAISGTRAMVNLIYGGRKLKRLAVGI